MVTKKELEGIIRGLKGCIGRMVSNARDYKQRINFLIRKNKCREKQIIYLVKMAYPLSRYTVLRQEVILKKYLTKNFPQDKERCNNVTTRSI